MIVFTEALRRHLCDTVHSSRYLWCFIWDLLTRSDEFAERSDAAREKKLYRRDSIMLTVQARRFQDVPCSHEIDLETHSRVSFGAARKQRSQVKYRPGLVSIEERQ